MKVGSTTDPQSYAAARLPEPARLDHNNAVADIQSRNNAVAAPVTKAHPGATAAAVADISADRNKDEFAQIADFAAGRSARPPAGWRQAGTSELSEIGMRSDAISSLPNAQFARIFTAGTGKNQRIAVHFSEQSGHWQQWLKAGGHGFGPATAPAAQQKQFVSELGQATNATVTVIDENSAPSDELLTASELHSDLKWHTPDPGRLAYIQDSGRAIASNIATLF
ncbi:hypothetical protein [Parasphingorhabdus cellanae]|uniref:Uncharacterized protein n=1 Tax=Parasphingorhabdus cellanae TaxID=2806553 RepID=A0ABX7T3I3_9SPHN|nr:hypothetical protein [Parasphingorhabdus cellanae]QTD56123.1 hypothetical protein J4G78_00485 [Parasphingorhabdus cellanae]